MKKYFIASVVAMMAFAFAAFAASLNVFAPALQAGVADDLECADSATIAAWYYNDMDGTVDGVKVVLNEGHTCNGLALYATPLDGEGESLVPYATGMVTLTSATTYDVTFGSHPASNAGPVDAESIEGIRVGIDQGHVDYVAPSPS